MSHFRCPLCGKQASVNNYDPDGFDDGITVVVVRGLGRGKGFETVGEYPIESYPGLLERLKKRLREVNKILGMGDGELVLTLRRENQMLKERLNEETKKKVAALEELEELDLAYLQHSIGTLLDMEYAGIGDAVNSLIDSYDQVSREYYDLSEEYEELLDYINEQLPEEHPEYDDLTEAVDALIQVYEDELEELGDSL